jgi:hypothetical protein
MWILHQNMDYWGSEREKAHFHVFGCFTSVGGRSDEHTNQQEIDEDGFISTRTRRSIKRKKENSKEKSAVNEKKL